MGSFGTSFCAKLGRPVEIRPDVKIVPLRMFILGALNWTMEWFDPERYSVGDFARQINAVVFDGVKVEGNPEYGRYGVRGRNER